MVLEAQQHVISFILLAVSPALAGTYPHTKAARYICYKQHVWCVVQRPVYTLISSNNALSAFYKPSPADSGVHHMQDRKCITAQQCFSVPTCQSHFGTSSRSPTTL